MAKVTDIQLKIHISDASGALQELVDGLFEHGATATPELRRFCSSWVSNFLVDVDSATWQDEATQRVYRLNKGLQMRVAELEKENNRHIGQMMAISTACESNPVGAVEGDAVWSPQLDLVRYLSGTVAALEDELAAEKRHISSSKPPPSLRPMDAAPMDGTVFEVIRERPESVLVEYVQYKRKLQTIDGYECPCDAEGWTPCLQDLEVRKITD